jgi:hypothetical protein
VTTRRAWQTEAHPRYGVTRGEERGLEAARAGSGARAGTQLIKGRQPGKQVWVSATRSGAARTEPMDASADVVRSPEGEGTPEGVEPGSLLLARQHIEEVKAGLRDDPGRAYSVQFTAAAEMLREHDPVQFRSLRSLLLRNRIQ